MSAIPAFTAFVDDYFNAFFDWSPSSGTAAGLHQYDSKIEDLSAAAISHRVDRLKQLQAQLARCRQSSLSFDETIDAEILDGQIKGELLDLETLQTWRTNPMGYVSLPGGAIDGLIKRTFAPPQVRLKAVVARLKGVPGLIEAMKQNVENPPREFTDLSIRIAKSS